MKKEEIDYSDYSQLRKMYSDIENRNCRNGIIGGLIIFILNAIALIIISL
jgi:hypothetical protein